MKGIKIHYLFSKEPSIDKFLSNSEIMVRITKGRNWNRVIAEGSSNRLYEENEKHSMRKAKKILLFDAESKYSVAGLHIGARMEGKSHPLNLTLLPHHDAFMVENYSNCYALPPEWMETIDPTYSVTRASQSYSYPLKKRDHPKHSKKALLPSNKKQLVL